MILPSSSADEGDEKSLELHFMAFGENQEFSVEAHYIDEHQFANAVAGSSWPQRKRSRRIASSYMFLLAKKGFVSLVAIDKAHAVK
jgi:hypothetical protein